MRNIKVIHFEPSLLFQILDDSRKWWKARNSRGQVAHVPHTIVTPYAFKNYRRAVSKNIEPTKSL